MNSNTYNGHKNYDYWNVSLWINNDESTYRWARSLARRHGRKEAARRLMQDLPANTPDGVTYTQAAIYAALEDIA